MNAMLVEAFNRSRTAALQKKLLRLFYMRQPAAAAAAAS